MYHMWVDNDCLFAILHLTKLSVKQEKWKKGFHLIWRRPSWNDGIYDHQFNPSDMDVNECFGKIICTNGQASNFI